MCPKKIFYLERDQMPGLFSSIRDKKLPLSAVRRLSGTLSEERLSCHINMFVERELCECVCVCVEGGKVCMFFHSLSYLLLQRF